MATTSNPVTFTAPHGADPVEHILRIQAAATIQPGDALYAGEVLRSRIRERTLSGVDVHGAPFAPYSERYRKQKAARLGSADVVNLFGYEHHPHMLNAMLVRVGNFELGGEQSAGDMGLAGSGSVDSMQLGFWDEEAALKAKVHNEGATIRTRLGSAERQMSLFHARGRQTKKGGKSTFTMPQREFFAANSEDERLMEMAMGDRMEARLKALK